MVLIHSLRWDPLNVAHIARHGVTLEEVEELWWGDPVSLQGHEGRIILLGPTGAGRMIAAVLDPEGEGVYYPVTARPAKRKERRYYQDQKGGE